VFCWAKARLSLETNHESEANSEDEILVGLMVNFGKDLAFLVMRICWA